VTAVEDDPPDRFGGPFGVVPAWILTAKHNGEPLTGSDLRVYLALRTYANRSGDCHPKIRTLAERADVHLVTAKKSIAKFAAMGLIEITHQYRADGSQRSSQYHLTDVSPVEPTKRDVDEWREADRTLFVELLGAYVRSNGDRYGEGRVNTLAFYDEFRTRAVKKGEGTKFRWPGRFVDSLDERRFEEWLAQEGIELEA